MHAVCDYCGNKADITILGRNKHEYTFSAIDCKALQEQAQQPGGAKMTGKCEHLEAAVHTEVQRFRQTLG
jgi:hypothetical protein